jgi:signal peptidase I
MDPPSADLPKHRRTGPWRALGETALIIVCALVISALVRAFLVQAFYVPSASMESTLMPSDRIIASKITTRVAGPQRGEIMVFGDPGGWLPAVTEGAPGWQRHVSTALTNIGLLPSDSGNDLVKRVIGLPGDRVACCDSEGRIVLNGVPLIEPYVAEATDQVRFDVTVGEGDMFMLGDNRANSRDSRYHLDSNGGGVPIANAVGRVVLRVWPLDRWGIESIPEIFGNPAIAAGRG